MPASAVVVLDHWWWFVGIEKVIDVVQFPPRERVAQHFTCFLNVEVPRSQEPQNVGVFRDLEIKHYKLLFSTPCGVTPINELPGGNKAGAQSQPQSSHIRSQQYVVRLKLTS